MQRKGICDFKPSSRAERLTDYVGETSMPPLFCQGSARDPGPFYEMTGGFIRAQSCLDLGRSSVRNAPRSSGELRFHPRL